MRSAAIVLACFLVLLLGGCGSTMNPVSLEPTTWQGSDSPNTFLVCPADTCAAQADLVSREYPVDAERLKRAWLEALSTEPRTTLASSADEELVAAMQKSRWLGFVDDIVIRILPLSETSSTFAALSRSRTGYYDFGVNEKRVRRLLDKVEDLVRSNE